MTGTKDYKLWGGRFAEPNHELMERFNASLGFDRRLFEVDIAASKAHAAMLAEQGIIGREDAEAIISGLEQVRAEITAGDLELTDPSLEDIHTAVEARLQQLIGEAAGRLHTARSRNDQVATDLRLWVMAAGRELDQALLQYQRALVELAEKHLDTLMPAYTHLQPAQPTLLAHHLLAYYEMARRDRRRLADCLARAAVLPLGAAACTGTTYPIDQAAVAEQLGFTEVCANSLDAVSDRDFAAEYLFVLSLVQIHLSRLAEELIIWSSAEFGFVTPSDAFATGSSIMPQKKNPDAAELMRGKTGRVIGSLVGLLTVLKGLPLAYNKDLQEDKEPVFDAHDHVLDSLRVAAPMLEGLTVHADRMRASVAQGFLNATELADYLAAKGVPFRQAHEMAGRAVRLAEQQGVGLEQLELAQLQGISDQVEDDVYEALDPRTAVNRRTSAGGTSAAGVAKALKEARKRLWPPKK